jgi:hypothetical protein
VGAGESGSSADGVPVVPGGLDTGPGAAAGLGNDWVDAAMAGDASRVFHARVSSHDQRAGLGRRLARVTEWARDNGHRGE